MSSNSTVNGRRSRLRHAPSLRRFKRAFIVVPTVHVEALVALVALVLESPRDPGCSSQSTSFRTVTTLRRLLRVTDQWRCIAAGTSAFKPMPARAPTATPPPVPRTPAPRAADVAAAAPPLPPLPPMSRSRESMSTRTTLVISLRMRVSWL